MHKKQLPIKLLHLTSSLKVGGAEAVLYDLLVHLDQKSFEHHVIYFHDGPYVKRVHELGIATHHITGLLFRYDPIFFMRFFLCIKKLRPDCIHTLLWFANVVGRLIAYILRIPCVSVVHNNVNQDGHVRALIDWLTLSYADRLVAVSNEVKQSVLKRNTFIPASRIHVIMNGIDAQIICKRAYCTAKKRWELGLTEQNFVIGSVGRFVLVKNYGLLLESFAHIFTQCSHTRLLLIGSGPYEQQLRTQARTYGVDHVIQFIIDQRAESYYPLFDCFVQTSSQEGISIALLEAMSCGIPCIVTNVVQEHSVITSGKDGIVVPAHNKKILKQTLVNIMIDNDLRKRLGYAAQRTVREQFQIKTMVQAYSDMFKQCIKL